MNVRYLGVVGLVASWAGCAQPPPAAHSVDRAWSPAHQDAAPPTSRAAPNSATPAPSAAADANEAAPSIAVIREAQPVLRDEFVELLLASHGPTLLKELVVIHRAEALARQRRIVLREEDVDRERDAVLAGLLNPQEPGPLRDEDRAEAERLLDAVLIERGSSREEFRLSVRRQALLRKLAEADIHISETDIDLELKRDAGERVVARMIRTPTPQQADAALSELRRGTPFAEVAQRYGADPGAARSGGLLRPFGRDDDRVPALLRDAAFALAPGEVSNPLRVGAWYHVLQVERRLAPDDGPVESREQVRQRLLRQRGDDDIAKLYARLMSDEGVTILDPTLKRASQRPTQEPGRR